MTAAPVAADDGFTAAQGLLSTTITGDLRADNGNGTDSDSDGTLLGYAGAGFDPALTGEDYLGAFFSNGVFGFLYLQHSGYVTFPVFATASVLLTAEGGRVTLHTDGTFSYQAPAGFTGVDWFDYTLIDADYTLDQARVTLTVTDTPEGNDRPEAQDDAFAGISGQQITGNLLADNGAGADSDSNGDGLSVLNRTTLTARGGVVSVYLNGDFVYTPPAGFSGTDSFTYTLNDEHGASQTASVSLTVISAPAGARLGTAAADAMDGTELGDHIFGLGGNDNLAGSLGDDSLHGGDANDRLQGGGGRDTLCGDGGRDTLKGGGGADLLEGGEGRDTLSGGGGKDVFLLDWAAGNSHDRIMDFRDGDCLAVNAAGYGLTAGTLSDQSYFAEEGAANAGHGRFLYAASNQSLYWDADGDAATNNVIIAVFDHPVTLDSSDFRIL